VTAAELAALEAKATKGNWIWDDHLGLCDDQCSQTHQLVTNVSKAARRRDGKFIVALRNEAPRLIAALAAQEALDAKAAEAVQPPPGVKP
jgi:hypothetical protein